MNTYKFLLFTILLIRATTASAFEMPKELMGNYVYANEHDACKYKKYSLVITKSGVEANEFNCNIIGKFKGQPGRYSIPMECSSEDGSSKSMSVFSLAGNKLKFDSMDYLACHSNLGTVKKPSSLVTKCYVNEGYAGVASYYDPALKKVATDPIRDFDGYTFIKEKEVITGSVKSYFGKLIQMNGTTSEGSYVHPDDWNCK